MDKIRQQIQKSYDDGKITTEEFIKANIQYSFLLEKAEGDRGGKVVGHTKSGHPIYANWKFSWRDREGGQKRGSWRNPKAEYRDLIATHKETGESHKIATHHRDSERYSKDPRSRITTHIRNIHRIRFEKEGLSKVIHPDIKVGSAYSRGREDSHLNSWDSYSEPSSKTILGVIEEAHDRIHKK